MNEISIPTFEDEIFLWQNLTNIDNGCMTDQVALTFGDGSMLKIEVKVRIPRSPELTISARGQSESYHLMVQSTAVRLMHQLIFSPALTQMPKRKTVLCPKCHGFLLDNQLVCDVCEGHGGIFNS